MVLDSFPDRLVTWARPLHSRPLLLGAHFYLDYQLLLTLISSHSHLYNKAINVYSPSFSFPNISYLILFFHIILLVHETGLHLVDCNHVVSNLLFTIPLL